MRALKAALLAWVVGIGGAAQAATYQPFDFTVELKLVSHRAGLLGSPSATWEEFGSNNTDICRYDQPCYPAEFRPSDAPFPAPEITTFRFWSGGDVLSSRCAVPGLFLSCKSYVGMNTGQTMDFHTDFLDAEGSITIDFSAERLVYLGPAGSHSLFSYPGCPPIYANFCSYSFQRVEYEMTDVVWAVRPQTIPIPLPASAWMLLAALGGMGAAARRKQRMAA